MTFYDQSPWRVRFEWGSHALESVAKSDVVVIVDVLSFTTCVEMAATRGARIFPYPLKGEAASEYARMRNATLAGRRYDTELVATGVETPVTYSLAPSSLLSVPHDYRLVLPSPNGSALAFQARDMGCLLVAGCLRNATAVGHWARASGKSVTVVAAGERWPDGSIRFATEDLVGAGAILSCFEDGRASADNILSPEARMAVAAFRAVQNQLFASILGMSSGRELQERGYVRDIELASEYNVSQTVPLLSGDCFIEVCDWSDTT